MAERVVLARSGGPVDPGRLAEETGAEVVVVAVDLVGGLRAADEPAPARGAVEVVTVDAREEFAAGYCLPAVQANAGHLGTRPLLPALADALTARHLVEAARRYGARTVAHDRTGAARTRFEAALGTLAPDLAVLAPAADPPVDVTGHDTGYLPDAPDPDELVVTFDQGVPVAVDGETVTALEAVRELDRRAGAPGAGRLRAPGVVALATAHRELEELTLERDLARFKRRVERRWGGLVRAGLWFSPLKQALDAFVTTTQRHVSGEVRLVLHGGRAVVADRRADEPWYDFALAT